MGHMAATDTDGALSGLRAAAERVDRATPCDRDRYADLIRLLAILVVVYGHWLAAVIHVRDGEVAATQLLVVEPWTRWATWVVQVMPLFFLVGGRVNAGSLERARERGQSATAWVRKRSRRLLRPLLALLAVWVPMGPLLVALGVSPSLAEEATEAALLPLWFLVVYLLVIVLAPVTLRLHRRLGWPLVVAVVVLVGVVDALDRAEVPIAGQVNYLLVFAVAHQLGYLWHDGGLPTGRRALHLAWIGLGGVALLVGVAGYPRSMVGMMAGADSNATPPTLALVALTLLQLGAVLAAARPAERWLRRHPVPWAAIASSGPMIITIFLWHMTALVVVASLTHLTGWWPEVNEVDGRWWSLRPAWLALCTVALAPLVAAFRGLEGGGDPVPGRTSRTVAGVGLTGTGLGVVLTEGLYDPDRDLAGLPAIPLVALAVGLLLLGIHHRARADAPS
jgi:fucose 4-O-acetylase-like acetyltransferase